MFPQQLDINRDGVNVPILKIKIKNFPKCALFFKNERAFEMHVLFHLKNCCTEVSTDPLAELSNFQLVRRH